MFIATILAMCQALRLIPLFLLLAASFPLSAQTVTIPEDVSSLPLWPGFEVLEDVNASLKPSEVARQSEDLWQTLADRHQHFGNRDSARWARFTLESQYDARWILVHEQTFVDDVDLFRRNGDAWRKVPGLREQNRNRWFGGARNPAFELEIAAGESRDYLLRVKTLSLQRFPLTLRTPADFRQRERLVYMISGALIAASLIVALFMFLLWRVQRQRGFLIVTGLILAEMTGAAWVGGVLYTITPWADPRVLGIVGLSSWIAALCFGYAHARIFLCLDRDAPRLARVFRLMPWVILGTMGFELAGSALGRNLLIYIAFFSLLVFVGVSVWQARRTLPYAWVYAWAWGTYFASISLTVLNLHGVIAPNASNLLMFAQGSIVSLLFAIAVVGQLRDLERRTQARLAASNERFSLAGEGATVGLFDWELSRRSLFLSRAAQIILDLQEEEHSPVDVLRHLPGSARRKLFGALRFAVDHGDEKMFAALEIKDKPVHVSGALAYTGGRLTRLSGSVADASQILELERARARTQALEGYRMLFDNAPIGLYRAGSSGELLRINPALVRLLGCESEEELRSCLPARLWHRSDQSFTELMKQLEKKERVRNFEYDMSIPGGSGVLRVVENLRITQRHDDGSFICEGAIQDISERHIMERELRVAHDKVAGAMADRSRLFAATNHDLRQPLQSLGLFIELVGGRARDRQILRWIEQMRASHLSLSDTLDGLLALSRLESGTIEPQREIIELAPLLKNLADEYAEVAASKNLVLTTMPTSRHVNSDRRLLERILRNLITNAVRYTDAGRVMIGCRGRGEHVAIQVWDTGGGIEPEAQKLIFDEFRQADAGRRMANGVGLGLAIVRGLSSLLDIKVQLRSTPGKGSCFELLVPRASQVELLQQSEARDTATCRLDGLTLLVVEDEAQVRNALVEFLDQRGATVTGAAGIEQACSSLEQLAIPDALIFDYHLSDTENGLVCLQRIRQRAGRELPGVLVTGEASGLSLDKVGNLAVLRKPVAPERLARAILAQLEVHGKAPTA